MANVIKFLVLVLLTFGCSANVESPDPEPTPACAPVATCDAHEPGYSWVLLSETHVGGCHAFTYTCVADGQKATDACEKVTEATCGDYIPYDPNYGERGE